MVSLAISFFVFEALNDFKILSVNQGKSIGIAS
jgi:hypothetical protein